MKLKKLLIVIGAILVVVLLLLTIKPKVCGWYSEKTESKRLTTLQDSLLDYFANLLNSSPLPARVVEGMHENFVRTHIYKIKDQSCVVDSIQIPTIKDFEIKLDVNFLSNEYRVRLDALQEVRDSGIALSYALLNTAGGNRYFSYIVSKAIKSTSDQWRLKPLYENNHLVFTMNGPRSLLDDFFQDSLNTYNNVISMDEIPCNQSIPKVIMPRTCIYTYESLRKFFEHNHGRARSHVFISNGAISIKKGYPNPFYAQTPILRWGNLQKANTLDNRFDIDGSFYRDKALDVGILCPPDCKTM
jgi:hypothetical protein